MVAKEKRRVVWSVAVGVLLAFATEGIVRGLEWNATSRLRATVADCKKPDPKDPVGKGHWEPVCEPDDLRGMKIEEPHYTRTVTDDELIADGGVTAQIIRADQKVAAYRADRWQYSGMVLALSFLPLIWYFLLDRIREISAAVLGRDRP
ncbi:hypothetical protein [Candidatus Binatus sp.]|jgi:hypothetical protein|uniref:hypothetical protein n=1 Tax=Candidatus Binatus sp. TaxID=2811406 RepID=UPI003BED38AC